MKDCATVIAGSMSHLINPSLKTSTLQQIWKRARITPLSINLGERKKGVSLPLILEGVGVGNFEVSDLFGHML